MHGHPDIGLLRTIQGGEGVPYPQAQGRHPPGLAQGHDRRPRGLGMDQDLGIALQRVGRQGGGEQQGGGRDHQDHKE